MQTYCVSCKKNTGNKDAKVIKIKNGRLQMRFHCSVCENKKVDLQKHKKQKECYPL